MAIILTELHILHGAKTVLQTPDRMSFPKKYAYLQNGIFRKHDASLRNFMRSLRYYQNDAELFFRLYEEIDRGFSQNFPSNVPGESILKFGNFVKRNNKLP